MDENNKKIALFRYSIIAPVITESGLKQTTYFKKMSQKEYEVPVYGKKRYRWKTFKNWLRLYRLGGFDTLLPRKRSDAGIARKIDPVLKETIESFYECHPYISVATLYKRLVADGTIDAGHFCEETLRRFIKTNQLKPKKEIVPRKKFEKPYVNDLWMSDFMHGNRLFLIGNKKRKLYLCAIIDDHSRYITAARWALNENTDTLELTLKDALLTCGMPKLFYCDNGAAYSSSHLQLACARLEIALIHSKPYDSPSRGKIERFWRTVRSSFLPLIDFDTSCSLTQFNQVFQDWLNNYHDSVHRGIASTPRDRYLDGLKKTEARRFDRDYIEVQFYQTTSRRVKNDATISIDKTLFEVPHKYIGQKIEVRHATDTPRDIWLYENEKPVIKLIPVDPVFNSQIHPSIQFAQEDDK